MAISDGDPGSFALADELVAVFLDDPLVRHALAVRRDLHERSPFALVRTVELAKLVLDTFASAPSRQVSADGPASPGF